MTAPEPAAGPVLDEPYEEISVFADWGIRAFTTTRAAGSFSVAGREPVGEVMGRWSRLREALGPAGGRFATASQVHGRRVLVHGSHWHGWLRADAADGHFTTERATSFAVTVADCVPLYLAHPSGAAALLHSGWRGTAAGILQVALQRFSAAGLNAADLRLHAGPAVCGRCYEVSPDVYHQLTQRSVSAPTTVDLRALLAGQARAAGVRAITLSDRCTRCDNDRFFSHRAGDAGRQLGVLATPV
ncbi:MAG TPA: polyphenol oxidase family protein [Gemmatimonadaceae bacterium]|nr:polyphenol oxidase family protein [Gemmatimonadaceae bacterium]